MKLVISRPKGNNFSGKGLYIDSSDLVELFSTNQRRLQNILCVWRQLLDPYRWNRKVYQQRWIDFVNRNRVVAAASHWYGSSDQRKTTKIFDKLSPECWYFRCYNWWGCENASMQKPWHMLRPGDTRKWI